MPSLIETVHAFTHFMNFFFPFNFIIRRILLFDKLGKKVEN